MIKTRKFQLGGEDMGHNENEWGKIKNTKKVEVIEAYDLKWNIDKENNCITCGKNYKFIGSEFCSKKCYKNYFIPKLN
jgi:hypothetical protein